MKIIDTNTLANAEGINVAVSDIPIEEAVGIVGANNGRESDDRNAAQGGRQI